MRQPLKRSETHVTPPDLRKGIICKLNKLTRRAASLSPSAKISNTSTEYDKLGSSPVRLNNECSVRYLTSSSYRDYINKLNRPIYLDFSSCDNLEEYIHYSDNIVSINLSNTKFKWIPDNMQSVKFLYLDNCQNISNIDNISKMKSLIKLDL